MFVHEVNDVRLIRVVRLFVTGNRAMVRNSRSACSGNDAAADWRVRVVLDDIRAKSMIAFDNLAMEDVFVMLQPFHIVHSMR